MEINIGTALDWFRSGVANGRKLGTLQIQAKFEHDIHFSVQHIRAIAEYRASSAVTSYWMGYTSSDAQFRVGSCSSIAAVTDAQ
jgi:hypothetical protein